LDFEFDAKDLVYVRIDRRRKLPVTTLLMALDSEETDKARAEKLAKGERLDPQDARGMSADEILTHFYGQVVYTRVDDGWRTAFDPERMRGLKLVRDLIDAKTNKAVAEAGAKMTPRLAKKLQDAGLKAQLVADEELIGHFIATDLIEDKTGLVLCEAGDEVTVSLRPLNSGEPGGMFVSTTTPEGIFLSMGGGREGGGN